MDARIIPFLKRFTKAKDGNALMLVGLAMPALVGGAGLAMDSIQWTLAQRQLQRQADSAALAGAFARAQGYSAATAANASVDRDNLLPLSATPVVENAPTTGPYAGNTNAVRVVLESEKTLPFSNIFLNRTIILEVEATAASVTNGNYCVISLERGTATGLTLQGSANVTMGCGMATNSRGSQALSAGGSSMVTASHLASVGGMRASASNIAPGTVLNPFSVPQTDPFASLPTPTVPNPCDPKLSVNPNNSRTIENPGTRCFRGLDIKGTVNFASGIYIIDGDVSFGSQAVVTGTGVTFILTSSTPTNANSFGSLGMNGGATINLSATTTGPYAGVLFYQDRRAPVSSNTINGNSSSSLQGAFYFPTQDLSFSGTSGMVTDCVQLVSRRVTFIGNNTIVNECPADSGAGSFLGTRVYLVG